PPVADDKNGGLFDRRAGDTAAVNCLLDIAEQGMHQADDRGNGRHIPVAPVDGEAVANEKGHPAKEVAPLPDVRRPFLAWNGRLGCCVFLGRGNRHGRSVDVDDACALANALLCKLRKSGKDGDEESGYMARQPFQRHSFFCSASFSRYTANSFLSILPSLLVSM